VLVPLSVVPVPVSMSSLSPPCRGHLAPPSRRPDFALHPREQADANRGEQERHEPGTVPKEVQDRVNRPHFCPFPDFVVADELGEIALAVLFDLRRGRKIARGIGAGKFEIAVVIDVALESGVGAVESRDFPARAPVEGDGPESASKTRALPGAAPRPGKELRAPLTPVRAAMAE
jgi:hypothetical protein